MNRALSCHSERSEESLSLCRYNFQGLHARARTAADHRPRAFRAAFQGAAVKKKLKPANLDLTVRAERALRDAVARVIVEHRQKRLPLAIWRNGKVALVPAGQVRVPRLSTEN